MRTVPELDDRRARALLCAATEPSHLSVGRAVAEHGAIETAGRVLRRLGERRAAAALAAAELDLPAGVRFLVPGDPEWPTQLGDLGEEVPHGLYARGGGDLRLLALRSVAVVGARAATGYGTRVASSFGTDLARLGWCVTSGGAYGIDAAAHRGCLAAPGPTIAVLASGVDVAYPATHDSLFARCAEDGLVVSEAPPGEQARRWRFLDRNRIIAALTRGTVVVEAAARSGALSTARRAADIGRVVMGVPGPITSGASVGVHDLLVSGAALVTTAAGVAARLGLPSEAAVAGEELGPESLAVLEALRHRRAMPVADIAAQLWLTTAEALAELALLEMLGLAARTDEGWVSRAAPRAGGA